MDYMLKDFKVPLQLSPEHIALINEQKICQEKFIEDVKDELTVSCSLPISIPNARIIKIIEKAKDWFYKNYEYSVEEICIILHKDLFNTPRFKEENYVQMPPSIFSIFGVIEPRESSSLSHYMGDKDFSIDKLMFANFYNNNVNIAKLSDSLMYYVITESLMDMTRQLFFNKITFYYNQNTQRLRFLGEKPREHIILEVYKKIEDCALFRDEIFYRWVVAQCRINLATILGTFNYTLPGNVQINFDMIQSAGTEELDRIREEVKSEEGTDWFLTS